MYLGQEIIKRYEGTFRRASSALGVARIDHEDGLVIQALATTSMRNGLFADLGSGVGYSTLWIVAGLLDICERGCKVYAVERSAVRAEEARRLFSTIDLHGKVSVEVIEGDAINFLNEIEDESLDMAFVDIDKGLYIDALLLLERKLRKGGIAVFHNAIFPPPPRKFIERASKGSWRSSIIPTSMGLLLAVKS